MTFEEAVKEDVNKSLNDWAKYIYLLGYEAAKSEIVYCKDCKYSDTFSDMTAEPHSQLKCLGIRYGGVEPMWYCEHGKRKEE